jgi:hypothetical protein
MTGPPKVKQGQRHNLQLHNAEDLPRELLGPRLPVAPLRWRCVTPEPEFPGAAVPRGRH